MYRQKNKEFYDTYADDYMANTVNLRNLEWEHTFISHVEQNSSILDLGCAFGRDCRTFTQQGFTVFGVDISRAMIAKAKKFAPQASFVVMDMLQLGFNEQLFAGVWCSATLLHISKKEVSAALLEMRRVLQPGGVLYLNLKKGQGEELMRDERYNGAEKFYSYFSAQEIQAYLEESGFSMIKISEDGNNKGGYCMTKSIISLARAVR